MASILMSRSMIRIFSGFKHILSPRYEVTRIPKLQTPRVNLSIVRSAQKAVGVAPQAGQKLDRVLYRIDSEIRRTGRISRKEVEDVIGELKYRKYASGTQSLLLLRCLGSLLTEELPEVRNKLVQEVWDTLIRFSIPLDISHYNTLLRVYIENGHEFSPIEFLSALENAGIEPNRVTYQRLILRYCQLGDIEGASKILEFMKEKELPVNEYVFNSLIIGHARANDMESAHGVLSVMKTSGLTPSAETYMNLMVGYAEKGDMEGLEKVMNECESSEEQLQNREYMEVIYALASKGHSRHVSVFIEKLEKIIGYQQDAMNLIYRLINASCDEVAYQVFETMSVPQNHDGETAPVGTFFLKQLIKSELYSVVTVVQYCQKMKREGLNIFAMERALQFALSMGRADLALALMRVIVEDGGTLRSHYFWPVLVCYASEGDKENIYRTISEMIALEVPVSLDTCRQYIMPSLLEKDKDEEPVILQLKENGMSMPSIINGCISYYMEENDIVSAAHLLSRYKVKVTDVLRRDLADAYVKTKEATAAAVVLRQMVLELPGKDTSLETMEVSEEGQEEFGSGRSGKDIGGMFLMDISNFLRPVDAISSLTQVLQAMKAQGVGISKDSVTYLQSRLGEHLTEDVVNLLNDLSSGDLTLQPIARDFKPLNQHSLAELEHRLMELEIKNQPRSYILGQLLSIYSRMKNVEKAEETLKKLEAIEFPLTTGQQVLLIEMYVEDGQLEKALNLYEHLRQNEPESKMNLFKVLKLGNAMISKGMLEETFKLLEDNAPESKSEESNDPTGAFSCASLLNNAIGKNGVTADVVQQLFDKLIENNYTKPVPIVCGVLIKVHMANDDLPAAMEAFENVCKKYSVTAMKHELTLACIKLEDTEKLQKIMDLSISIHGEMNSLYDLVFAFIECGKVRQAKKILETPGLRARHQRLETRCRRLLEEDRVTELEHLVAIVKDVFDVDRNMMFMYLFEAYRRKNDCDKALGVWTTMQEENIEPSETFLRELGQLLTEHGRKVPFVMPAALEAPVVAAKTKEPIISPKSLFNQACKEKNYDAALEAKERLESTGIKLGVTDASKLIEGLVQESRLEEATKLTRDMVAAGQYPFTRVMKYLMGKLSSAGDTDAIKFFEQHLNENLKKNLSINNKLCNAYMNAGRAEEFLDELSAIVDNTDIDVASIKTRFPAGGIMSILNDNSALLPKVSVLAEKYASQGISTPANCLWMHYFKEEQFPEAKEVYEKYLAKSEENLMFASITQRARDTNSVNLLPPLLEVLNNRPTTPPAAKGIVYSCWVDVLTASGKYDEALGVIEGSLKSIGLQEYNTSALNRLKEKLASSSKTFPYTIPKKEAKKNRQSSSSSSSSSSDSEGKP
ncbi:LOW QUALITY PROTEIN: leucine-rich PPR motif-containing protein, mitochondrial-like [Palaemon carinicauda]|uniref:LOW QUALITY PROTEIN: leucine-rich PPR motif-containing protein, mitochondrial-like n=1 Tax=Palaemon carinicauda TaxID=392227 RepID=UPI0035B681EB